MIEGLILAFYFGALAAVFCLPIAIIFKALDLLFPDQRPPASLGGRSPRSGSGADPVPPKK